MKNDTVSRQLVIDTLIPLPGIGRKAIDKIRDLPPADQPEIIKCMECIHYEADITGNPWGVCCHKDWIANNIGHDVDENGWCYRAERRTTE